MKVEQIFSAILPKFSNELGEGGCFSDTNAFFLMKCGNAVLAYVFQSNCVSKSESQLTRSKLVHCQAAAGTALKSSSGTFQSDSVNPARLHVDVGLT